MHALTLLTTDTILQTLITLYTCKQVLQWLYEFAGCDITLIGTPAAPSTPEIAAKKGHLNVVRLDHIYTLAFIIHAKVMLIGACML
jgi:hypothetical protein